MSVAWSTGYGAGAVGMAQSVGAAGIGVTGQALASGASALTAWWFSKAKEDKYNANQDKEDKDKEC